MYQGKRQTAGFNCRNAKRYWFRVVSASGVVREGTFTKRAFINWRKFTEHYEGKWKLLEWKAVG